MTSKPAPPSSTADCLSRDWLHQNLLLFRSTKPSRTDPWACPCLQVVSMCFPSPIRTPVSSVSFSRIMPAIVHCLPSNPSLLSQRLCRSSIVCRSFMKNHRSGYRLADTTSISTSLTLTPRRIRPMVMATTPWLARPILWMMRTNPRKPTSPLPTTAQCLPFQMCRTVCLICELLSHDPQARCRITRALSPSALRLVFQIAWIISTRISSLKNFRALNMESVHTNSAPRTSKKTGFINSKATTTSVTITM